MKRWLLPEGGRFYKANLHLHTTVSDGRFTPEEIKAAYREKGYSILAFTDHEIFVPHNDLSDDNFLALNAHEIAVDEITVRGDRYQRTYHLNFYAKSRETTLSPVFSESRIVCPSSMALVTDEMRKTDARAVYSTESVNELIRIGNENGFFVCYNHPVWSLQNYPDYIGLEGLWGIEVYNRSSVLENLPDTTVPFDDLLRAGKDVFPICSDDSHIAADCFGGWTMIRADSLAYDDVIAALLAGNFYSTTGPEIRELSLEDGVLTVRSGEAREVRIVTDWRSYAVARAIAPEREGEDFVARFAVTRLSDKYRAATEPDWQHSYFRVEVTGEGGKRAYTRPFRVKDVPELF
ncbi:MAG: PHP domain-containing protein [Clostridia bacterium]|nr:PHP domain-containing protein [Clostridia bacterium]